jgi:hypothetical protein
LRDPPGRLHLFIGVDAVEVDAVISRRQRLSHPRLDDALPLRVPIFDDPVAGPAGALVRRPGCLALAFDVGTVVFRLADRDIGEHGALSAVGLGLDAVRVLHFIRIDDRDIGVALLEDLRVALQLNAPALAVLHQIAVGEGGG